jgi:RNA polymerase sigma-B factor
MIATSIDPLKFNTLSLFQEYKLNKCKEIRNQIVQLNIGLAKKEVNHWTGRCSESYEDLLQVASLGLLRSVERFDLEKGNAFSSFATPYIKGEIQHYLRDKSASLRIPRRWLELGHQADVLRQKELQTTGKLPSDSKICHDLNITLEEWEEIKLAIKNQAPLSLDISISQDENSKVTLGDSIPDPSQRSFQLVYEDQVRLQLALEQLEEKTRKVLEIVFLQDLTQKQAAEVMGISVVTVSRQVKKGIEHLKKILVMEVL